MAKRKIYVYNAPILRRKARPVNQISGTIRKLVDDMFETMYENGGIGLAAPQVGVSKRVFIVDTREIGEKLALINPRILNSSKKDVTSRTEGCLSLPGIEVDVVRPRKVKVEYTDLDGVLRTLEAEDLLARVIQHEHDHLEGILIIDRAESEAERQKLFEELKELEAALHA